MRTIEAAMQQRAALPPGPTLPTGPRRPATSVHLDLDRLAAAGYLVPDQDRSVLAEEMQIAKRALLDRRGARARGGLVMVTSALPGEGKTFCSINLAMSLASEVDTSVLLVDADVLRPSVLARLGVRAERGLLDLLVDNRCQLADVQLATSLPKLDLLHTGMVRSRATELLASAAMDQLLSQLAAESPGRIVVFDAPPLLLTSAAATLASRVGQVLMVVDAARTSKQDVVQAYAAVEHCPEVMSLLNRYDGPPQGRRNGGYGYGYGYGYGDGDGDEPVLRASGWRRWVRGWGSA